MRRSTSSSNGQGQKKPNGSISPDIRRPKRKLQSIEDESTATKATKSTASDDKRNHDNCDACGGTGQFLCCDACPAAFHFTCLEPPMDPSDLAKLKDKWFCNECEHKQQNKRKRTRSNPRGLFHKLIEDISAKNPTSYRLPSDIIHFFKDVTVDTKGKYVDTSQIKQVRYKNGQPEHPDYHQLKEKNGKFRTCYHCRKTALTKPMISCDYCSLHWHLDCLNPPLASPPSLAKKWRCPTHIEHIIKPPREQSNPKKIIINNENKIPSSAFRHHISQIIEKEFNEEQDNESNSNDEAYVDNNSSSKSTPIPGTMVENLITSKSGVVYRLPVNAIQLDFTGYVTRSRTRRRSSIPSITESTSSQSEVNTPPIFNSPTMMTSNKPITHLIASHPMGENSSNCNTDDEVETCLQNLAAFQVDSQLFCPVKDDKKASGNSEAAIDNYGLFMLAQAAIQIAASPPPSPIPFNSKIKNNATATPSSPYSLVTPASENNQQQKRYLVDIDQYQKYLKIEKILKQTDEQDLTSLFQQL